MHYLIYTGLLLRRTEWVCICVSVIDACFDEAAGLRPAVSGPPAGGNTVDDAATANYTVEDGDYCRR